MALNQIDQNQLNEEPTIGKLVVDAQRDISKLISAEIQLAKSELKVSVKAGGIGIALFALAGFFGLLSIIIFSVALAYLIHWNGSGLDLHWAFLIVFGIYLLTAGLLAFVGFLSVKKVKGPERAIAQAKQNKAAFKKS
jgi:hypothetical protein